MVYPWDVYVFRSKAADDLWEWELRREGLRGVFISSYHQYKSFGGAVEAAHRAGEKIGLWISRGMPRCG